MTKGFTLIEMVVYVAIVAGVFAFTLGGIISLYKASETARASRAVNLSAAVALERISRELRDAENVVIASSTLGVSPGTLAISTDNASTTGGTYTFSLSSRAVKIADNTGVKSLTGSDVNVSELIFWHSTSTHGELVRVKLKLSPVASSSVAARTFYNSVVLRESYE